MDLKSKLFGEIWIGILYRNIWCAEGDTCINHAHPVVQASLVSVYDRATGRVRVRAVATHSGELS